MINFLEIKAINDSFEPELSCAIKRVVDSGWFILGNEVLSFENEYANYIGTKYCIGVANGLDALRLILRAYIEIGIMHEGDEIIVPANTFIATILAVTQNKLKAVLVEPSLKTYNIDPLKIEEKITTRTKAIIIVHLYGLCAMQIEIKNLAAKYNLKLIEDNAQSTGALYNELRTGSLGNASGHSFYPGKNLGCLGDGGAITTDNEELATVVRSLSNYGSDKKYIFKYQGYNSRLDEIQAAVLRTKLPRLDTDNQRRREIAHFYSENIRQPDIILPNPGQELSHVWHLYVIRTSKRNNLQTYLTKNEIQTLIHYPIPPHKQRAYTELNNQSFAITEQIHSEVLSLPISPVMKDKDIDLIVAVLNKF